MSSPFSKSKEKRPRTSSQPNKSFVKNVTSRVSGLLPATITKWFSSPSSSNTNGSAQVADATDSSTEDEAPESPIKMQPPAKKIRYTSPGEFSQQIKVETRCTSTNTESIDEIYTVNSTLGINNSRDEKIFASTRVHSANDDTTEETTQDPFYKSQHSLSAIEHSVSKKRKSLFGTPQDDSYKKRGLSKSANVRDPYFKPSLLSSPFYVGRTMYGGASSSYLTPSSFKKKTISVTNETSDNNTVTMSHSSRRVMDLLEHYSSPLIEAKRIPQIMRDPKKLSSNNSLQQSINPYGPKVYSYKTQELYVPTVASILTIKRKSRLMDTTNAARQIIASHSSSSEFLPYPKTNSGGDASGEISEDKLTTKIKSRLTRKNRERDIEMESNNSDTVNLPNVVLEIDKDNLPKFTFGPVSTSSPSQSSSIQTPVIITPDALKKNFESDKPDFPKLQDTEKDKFMEVKNSNDYYGFSRSVQISSESHKTSTVPKFSFSSPERQLSNIEKAEEVKGKDEQLPSKTSSQINDDNKLPAQKSPDWKCLDCWVMNKIDVNKCVCCGGNKPVEIDNNTRKCSVCNASLNQSQCNKCTDCEKKTKNVDKSFVAKEDNATKWKCNDCWINNSARVDKCVCCGGRNTIKIKPVALINSETVVEGDWTCSDCWIKNKSSLPKCAACGGLKPGSQAFSHSLDDNTLVKDSEGDNKVKLISDSNIAKSQSERWECPICLVRNASNRDTCICCEASKPGTEKESNIKFNFHQPSEITFKFGIQPDNQKSCTDIEPEESNMGEESETNNNILPKTSTFNFGLSVKKFEDLSQPIDKPAEAPKINFTFGVPKGDQMSSVKNTIFGNSSKSVETSKGSDEKLQEVPQVFTPTRSNEPLKKNLGLFNTPVTSQVAPEMPALVPLHLLNQNSAVKKDASFLNSSVVPATTSEANTQQNNFTFTSIMPAQNLFATTTTTTTTASNTLPGPLSMNIPSTTMSIFQKANIVTTTTTSFFQKTDSFPKLSNTTATTSVPTATMQSIFSFGGQGSVPQVEKPKFNFSFTNNKTDNANIFKPSFAVSSDNSVPSNKFNLPSNSIISGNVLSGTPLNPTTQINAVNPLTTGNTLTTPSGSSSIFGAAAPKENMWSSNTNNMFATNTTSNGVQKPSTFTFGAGTPFSANNVSFGSSAQQALPNNTPFGSSTQQTQPNNNLFGSTAQQTPPNNTAFGTTTQQTQPNNAAFGSTTQQTQPNNTTFGSSTQQAQPAQPAQNVFGITSQPTTNQPPMFGNHLPSQSTQNIFGGLQVPNNPMPMGMFGTPNQAVTPSFGTSNPPIPTFETPTPLAPQPAPTSFNFGGHSSNGIFGFGQQQQPSQAPSQPENPPGMYGFGGPSGAAAQMQFTIGSAPSTTVRRVRKAMRRTQR